MSGTDFYVRKFWLPQWQLAWGVFRVRDGWPDTHPIEVFDAESVARLHLDHITGDQGEEARS